MISRQFVLFLVGVVLGLGISLMIVLIVTGLMDDVIAHTKSAYLTELPRYFYD